MTRSLWLLLAAVVLGGCALTGGPTSSAGAMPVPGCPVTLAEVRAAVPDAIEQDPDVGGSFKNVTQQCAFRLPGVALFGGPSLTILVFDIGADGPAWADNARTDYPGAATIAGVGDGAWVNDAPLATDLFAARGQVGLHIFVAHHEPVAVERLAELARAAFARL
jgi:hypothetical protein